ncbi:amidohydrolase [Halogeometricum pallidum JCM 14848]|uniref:Amidohydrolase n=1 Tax=Halogeometricum pallidum JCM 14848 TaxID=1227487 RepID=M0D3W9_HALPD|nr:amidohydrolase [Halogeometricum pallidum]ELZ29387.1 amidohydrolase [Halogeometricum pallidum JCM 14848]
MNTNIQLPPEQYLIDLRREFHAYPEPGWCEYWTTVRIVEELEDIGVDDIHIGPDALDTNERLGVPEERVLSEWFDKAESKTNRTDILERIEGGRTGAVAVVDRGDGPTVGLRVDIDALPIRESTDGDHVPAAECFRSKNEGFMHACGHDAHVAFGLGTLRTVAESEFRGTFKVFFQPSEELLGGGKPMAVGPHVDDVDYLIGTHVGLDHPTGTVISGIDEVLALSRLAITFSGESAHAGVAPNQGSNAVQAFVTAASNVYGIPRHSDGATRVNVGEISSDNPANVIADRATATIEVRGESNDAMEYMRDSVRRYVESAAEMHGCEAEIALVGAGIREDSDEELVELVSEVANGIDSVSSVVRRGSAGASEDVTYLMRVVKANGGNASYIGIGGGNPSGHHTPTFDIDEDCLLIGVSTLSKTVLELLS